MEHSINQGGLWGSASHESSRYIITLITLQRLDMSLMQRQEITVWETKCYVWSSDVTVLDVLTANTHHQLLTEADRCKISIHAEETLMMRVLRCVCRLPISEMHDTAVGWGGGGNGFWHPDHWADVLHYAGKTKGQGQEFRWMSESPWRLEQGAIIIIILLHSAPSEVTWLSDKR